MLADLLASAAVLRDLLLARLASGYVTATERHMAEVAAEIEDFLKSGRELTEYQGRRLDRQIRELTSMVSIPAPDLSGVAADEARWQVATLASVGVEAVLPTAAALTVIADTALVQGATIGDWFSKLEAETRFNIERAVKVGVSLGRTNAQIIREIVGVISEGDKGPEAIKKARRDAEAITRTAVATVSNNARLATYEANADVLSGVMALVTLDGRTTRDICVPRSGKVWSVPDFKPVGHSIPFNGGPPLHWRCRTSLTPITRSFRDLGIDRDEIPAGLQASAYGPVASGLTFEQWLKTQPKELADDVLGKGRAELWQAGKITLTQLVDNKGNPLTLAELRARYANN